MPERLSDRGSIVQIDKKTKSIFIRQKENAVTVYNFDDSTFVFDKKAEFSKVSSLKVGDWVEIAYFRSDSKLVARHISILADRKAAKRK